MRVSNIRHEALNDRVSARLAYIRLPCHPLPATRALQQNHSWSGQRAPFRSKNNEVVSERFFELPRLRLAFIDIPLAVWRSSRWPFGSSPSTSRVACSSKAARVSYLQLPPNRLPS